MKRVLGSVLGLVTLCCSTVLGVAAASPAAAAGPELVSVSFPTATQDVTLKPGLIAVQVRGRNIQALTLSLWAKDPGEGLVGPDRVEPVAAPRTSGTLADGTYSGSLPLPAGTTSTWGLKISAFDPTGTGYDWDGDALTASGFPGFVATRTTAAPVAPAKLKVTTGVHFPHIGAPYQQLMATWAQTAGKPQAAEWLVTMTGKCRPLKDSRVGAPSALGYSDGMGTGTCTVSVRARNGAGTSVAVSGTGFFF